MSAPPVRLWGRKPSARFGRAAAALSGRATVQVEDGFLRSVRTGVEGDPALSHVLDQRGIYYDATTPSDLEAMIDLGDGADPALRARAVAGLARLRGARLSKYNAAPEHAPESLGVPADRPAVLVVDQTAGDLSLRYGLVAAATFAEMLRTARAAHPDATVVVKTHPAVTAGKRRGHFAALAEEPGLVVLRRPVNPWSLLERCRTVYVATSQLGFEALMAGCTVHCFGVPFYAGWGLTEDRQPAPRRRRRASVEEVFACAYLRYSHYREPYALGPCSFEETADHLVRLRDHALAHTPAPTLVGFDRWKRPWARRVFRAARGDGPRFRTADDRRAERWLPATPRVIGWASHVEADFVRACGRTNVPFAWMEDGFLRSVGLGSALVPGASYVLDARRPHYDAAGASDLEVLLETADVDAAERARAAQLRARLVTLGLSKYNVGRSLDVRARLGIDPTTRVVLVAGQVEDDMAVRKGTFALRTNAALLEAARARHPDAVLLYKPHPDVQAGLRRGSVAPTVTARLADAVLDDVGAGAAIAAADHVEVMTSLLGFEALLRGRSVACHGLPFYAGWGLTEDLVPCARRTRRRDLDELTAIALIRYARYVDPRTLLPCEVEHLLDRLGEAGAFRTRPGIEALVVLGWAAAVRAGRRVRSAAVSPAPRRAER